MIFKKSLSSPIDDLTLLSDGAALTGLCFAGREPERSDQAQTADLPLFDETERQLSAYFRGELFRFDLPLRLEGSPFQQKVWSELTQIPYGSTISYADLALKIGSPSAMRAVGSANGKNPIAIIVPCHRVIGSNGDLIGFGGGLNRKSWLLEHEARFSSTGLFANPFAATADAR